MSATTPVAIRENWMPSFIVIGAVKGATTWVQTQLQAHPDLFLPDVEPHYFSSEFERGEGYYRALFAAPPQAKLLGEKSADYLAHPLAAERIARVLPRARLVVQFRNPVDRAYSDYCMLYRRGTVKEGPEAYLTSLDNPQPRFLRDGLYAEHLARWLALFPEEAILPILYDDVKADPAGTIARVTEHIGAAPFYDAELGSRRENNGAARMLPLPVRKTLAPLKRSLAPLRGHRWFEATRSLMARQVAYPPLSAELRAHLQRFYAADVQTLGRMLGRDLSHWTANSAVTRAA